MTYAVVNRHTEKVVGILNEKEEGIKGALILVPIPDGTQVAIGWRYSDGQFSPAT